MTRGKRKSRERVRALKKIQKHLERKISLEERRIFNVAFNLGWKQGKKRQRQITRQDNKLKDKLKDAFENAYYKKPRMGKSLIGVFFPEAEKNYCVTDFAISELGHKAIGRFPTTEEIKKIKEGLNIK